jgi:hypothetical protein
LAQAGDAASMACCGDIVLPSWALSATLVIAALFFSASEWVSFTYSATAAYSATRTSVRRRRP